MTDKEIQEKAEKKYGTDLHLYGQQREGFIAGYNECAKDMYSESDVISIIKSAIHDAKVYDNDIDPNTYLKKKI
jgi:hypothetical protein